MKIAVIDYKMSNMFSIKNVLDDLSFDAEITSDIGKILSADGAILPGVGSFPEAMEHLQDLGLDRAIWDFIASGKPFMGICLGLQLLFSKSEEFGHTKGLGIFEGVVENFSRHENIKIVPHVGWNRIKKSDSCDNAESTPLGTIDNGEYFYFVHSYYVRPLNESDICTTTEYAGYVFCSSVSRDNVFACQFHPEKSGDNGIRILKEYFFK